MNSQRTERGLLLKGGTADGVVVDCFVNVFFRSPAFLFAPLSPNTEGSKEQPPLGGGKSKSEETLPRFQADFSFFHRRHTYVMMLTNNELG